jgi:hypothetical protein
MNRSREGAAAPQDSAAPATAARGGAAARSRRRGALAWLGGIGVAAALAAIAALAAAGAYYEIFSVYKLYDDEGLMMMSVRHVLDGHRLYDEVRVGYGPLYFLIKETIHGALGVPLTHDTVRITATVFRLLAAGLAAGVVFGTTRHVTLAGFGFLLVTVHLLIVRNEPGHPQELAAVVLMATPLVALGMRARRAPAIVAALGFLVAAMTMIKTNLGVFSGIAVWMAVLASMPANRLRLTLWAASAATATALPIVLMRVHLDTPWGGPIAGCAAASILAVALLATPRRDGGLRPAHLVLLAAAITGGIELFVLPHVLSGTSLATLIERLLVGPQSLIALFLLPLVATPEMVPATVAGVVLAALAAWTSAASGRRSSAADAIIAVAKLTFAVLTVQRVLQVRPDVLIRLFAPFAWLVLVPGGNERWSWEQRFVRLLLAWLAVIEPLQAYPVAGSQQWLGSVALVLCGMVCLGDAADWARALIPASARRPVQALAAAAMLAMTIMLAASWRNLFEGAYRARQPLDLPGATRLRLDRVTANTLRKVVEIVRDGCDPIFSYPGFNSLYFWTGQAPPTLELISHEIRLVTPDRLDEIVAVLARSPTACFVRPPAVSRQPAYPSFELRMAQLFGRVGEQTSKVIGKYSILRRTLPDANSPPRHKQDSAPAPADARR